MGSIGPRFSKLFVIGTNDGKICVKPAVEPSPLTPRQFLHPQFYSHLVGASTQTHQPRGGWGVGATASLRPSPVSLSGSIRSPLLLSPTTILGLWPLSLSAQPLPASVVPPLPAPAFSPYSLPPPVASAQLKSPRRGQSPVTSWSVFRSPLCPFLSG